MKKPNKAIAQYRITYERNGFVQYKWLIPSDNTIKAKQNEILELEYSLNKHNRQEVNSKIAAIKKQLKEDYGEQYFTDKSYYWEAVTTGVISLPKHQGGDHKCKIELV